MATATEELPGEAAGPCSVCRIADRYPIWCRVATYPKLSSLVDRCRRSRGGGGGQNDDDDVIGGLLGWV